MDWGSIILPSGCKLFKVHTFNYIHQGVNYLLEVDEYSDGSFSGHGEHSTDQNNVVESVSGKNIDECLNALIKKIESRAP